MLLLLQACTTASNQGVYLLPNHFARSLSSLPKFGNNPSLEKLSTDSRIVEKGNIQKSNMQDNLKKAFMRGVCALNFEAMNILDPNGEDPDLA